MGGSNLDILVPYIKSEERASEVDMMASAGQGLFLPRTV